MEKNNEIKQNLSIGFFDSGVGGLSVYSRFRKLLPYENLIYFGDLKNLPYGNKTQEQLICFARKILDFYKNKNVKAVVIACNTSSALAYEAIKDEYEFKIYPIIQSFASVISNMDVKRIGVFATNGTVESGAYKREITRNNSNIEVNEIACPNWVEIVESDSISTNRAYDDIKRHLDTMMEFKPDKIILGCTHYPYLMGILSKFVDESIFIDPAKIFVQYIKTDLENNNLVTTQSRLGSEKFYVSDEPEKFVNNAKLFYEVNELPEVVLF